MSDADIIRIGFARQQAENREDVGLPPGWFVTTAGEWYILGTGEPFQWDAMAFYSIDRGEWVWSVNGHAYSLPVPGCGKSDDARHVLNQYAWMRYRA